MTNCTAENKPYPSCIDKYASGEALRALIKSHGYKQYQFAELCGVTPTVISRFTNGQQGFNLETAVRISLLLGVGLDDWVVMKKEV